MTYLEKLNNSSYNNIFEIFNSNDKETENLNNESFKLNKWKRKDYLIRQIAPDLNDSFLDERNPQRRKNIPRSSRRKY